MADQMCDTARTDDLEFSQTADKIADIDPLTKQPLQNPVRNKICNHIYGRDSVMQSLQQNPRLRYVNCVFELVGLVIDMLSHANSKTIVNILYHFPDVRSWGVATKSLSKWTI